MQGTGWQGGKQTIGKAQLGRVVPAAEKLQCDGREPGILGDLLIKLCADAILLLLPLARWAKREYGYRELRQGLTVSTGRHAH